MSTFLIDEPAPVAAVLPAAQLTASTEPSDQVPLPRDFYAKSSLFGYVQTLTPTAVLLLSLFGVSKLPPVAALLAALVGAIAGYHLTFVLHDAAHATLFERRSENRVWGWLAGGLIGTDFPNFQRVHWIHHRHFRTPRDPQGSDYNALAPGRDAVLSHLLKPLFLVNFIEKFATFNANTPAPAAGEERSPDAVRIPRSTRLRALAWIVVCQALLFVLATGAGTRLWGYPLWLGLLVTVGLFLSRVRSYLEHGALLPEQAELRIARTHVSNPIERNLLSGLLFNYHNEHHRWPAVPSRLLPRVHREVTAGRLPAHDFSRSYWASLRVLYASTRRSAR